MKENEQMWLNQGLCLGAIINQPQIRYLYSGGKNLYPQGCYMEQMKNSI